MLNFHIENLLGKKAKKSQLGMFFLSFLLYMHFLKTQPKLDFFHCKVIMRYRNI